MAQSFTDLLTVALLRVYDAHAAYQKEHGPDAEWPDADWPRWYAERLTASLGNDRAELQGILHTALRYAGAAHRAYWEFELNSVHDIAWPTWYAPHMTRTLGANAIRLQPALIAFLTQD
ncbi:hypothetical protein I6N91_11005 [Arthrobacter sp. MSA 4-2]|uniref:hypothetical protein n=1 Tax=Arthrobacter sp. MSA 4-2 TaxID=2794349 RepID=UPI0018E8E95C|nr:hypothetical protein [Arthrobacter sp. MSA 4-2]MBJ2121505.1 hypothetical protein [Arthrobacter sp. MSA 4-2]